MNVLPFSELTGEGSRVTLTEAYPGWNILWDLINNTCYEIKGAVHSRL